MMYRGEMNDRLRLLYELHLPPALLPEDLESPTGDTQTGNDAILWMASIEKISGIII